MRTVADLIEALEQYPEDTEVRLAIQPQYPLALALAAVSHGPDAGAHLASDDDRPAFVWLAATDGVPYGEHPYAPRAAWDGGDFEDEED
jgi:hypothetical protein